jgi:hypothetical protein
VARSEGYVGKEKRVDVSEDTEYRPFSFEISNPDRPGWS